MIDPDDDGEDDEGGSSDESIPAVDPMGQSQRVGYRNPPREHAYRKGQSGNPRGRPKGARNRLRDGAVAATILRVVNRSVPVRGSDTDSMSLLHANVQTLAVQGAQGGVIAARSTAWIAMTAGEAQTRQDRKELGQIARYLSALREALDKYESRGNSSADPLFGLELLIQSPDRSTIALPDPPILLESIPSLLAETRALIRRCRSLLADERDDENSFMPADDDAEDSEDDEDDEESEEETGDDDDQDGADDVGSDDDDDNEEEVEFETQRERKPESMKRMEKWRRTMASLRAIELNLMRKLNAQD